ncbi:MAG: hypothetical protein M1542_01580 [Thermotogae bacterium]|nr:hypothetical protein [Thermotogota bacterium]MCL5031928.1 hypothetical protein [Thermotogota bacterium]
MKTLRTFINFFSGEIEIFVAGAILVLFITIVTMSLSMSQFFGSTVYLSRFFLVILISMVIAGISIQLSNVKRLTDGYEGYLFSSVAVIANSIAVIFETFEMLFYGMNWFGFDFLRVQTDNSLLDLVGFLIFLYTVLMTIISMLDLIYAVGES